MEYLFGFILLFLFGVVTWCVASEGAWGAGLTYLCVLFAGLLAMNFFEPLAEFIEETGGSVVEGYSDVAALVGLFALFTFLLRAAAEHLSPTDIEIDARAYQVARWVFSAATGYTTMAILLTALHTAPLPRNFIGFAPENRNFLDVTAPDREWLGFVQHVSEKVLPTGRVFDGTLIPGLVETDGQKYWPSFPMRYATRREELASGAKRVTASQSGGAQGSGSGGRSSSNAAF